MEYDFNPAANPYKFNPLAADVPKLGILLKSPPSISLRLTDTTGTNTRAVEITHIATVRQREYNREFDTT